MHMADALLSPGTGAVMWAAAAGTTVYCGRRLRDRLDDGKIPLMGVLGAFVFAAQMINFSIPGTGSSGHLGGGLLLAVLLGPHGAFLTLASVLTVQALFFADGGLLALGCNIFNLGFFPCFVAYPLIYKKIAGSSLSQPRIIVASLLAAVIGLQLGAFAVVLQTFFSGITALPLRSFLIMMQPIHLAIGLVEGMATAGVVSFIRRARPEILDGAAAGKHPAPKSLKNVLVGFLAVFIFTGTVLAWFASEHPDGLEWSIEKITGTPKVESPRQEGIHSRLEKIQEKTSLLPDYRFKDNPGEPVLDPNSRTARTGTSLSGLIGGLLVLLCSIFIGIALKRRKQPA